MTRVCKREQICFSVKPSLPSTLVDKAVELSYDAKLHEMQLRRLSLASKLIRSLLTIMKNINSLGVSTHIEDVAR